MHPRNSRLSTILGLIAALPLVLADDDDDEPGLKGTPRERTNAHIAHGVVAGLAFAILLPLGAIILRGLNHPKAVRIHRIWQLVALAIMLLGFALGLWLSYLHHEVYNEFHEWFGTFITFGFCVQPLLAVVHHKQWVAAQAHPPPPEGRGRKGKKLWLGKTHVWLGRLLLVLGIINGGLGFQLAQNTTVSENVIYICFVMVIALAYVGALIRWSAPRAQMQQQNNGLVAINSQGSVETKVEHGLSGKEDVIETVHAA